MKFLLQFMSCCGAQSGGNASLRAEEGVEVEVPGLARVAPPRYGRRKRGRVGSTASASEWRPKLRSISEDTVVAVEVEERRVLKKKGTGHGGAGGGGGYRNIACIPSAYVDDYRRTQFPAMIPSFSPAPFMI